MYKYKVRVPSIQYGYIEVECDTREEALGEHDFLIGALAEKGGLNTPDWAKVRKEFVQTGEVSIEDFEKMNKWQRMFIHQVRLANKE